MPSLSAARPAYVTFETRLVEKQKLREEGGSLYAVEEDWVKITPSGSKDVFEKLVKDWFETLRGRVEMQMEQPELLDHYQKAYAAWKQNRELPIEGTPIAGWPLATLAQQQLCKSLNLRTVEDLASANAEAVHRLGMGAQVLRNRAVDFLTAQKDTGPLVAQVESLRATVADLLAEVKTMREENRVLKGMRGVADVTPQVQMPEIYSSIPQVQLPDPPKIDGLIGDVVNEEVEAAMN